MPFVIRDACVNADETTAAVCYCRGLFLTKSNCAPEHKLTPAPRPHLLLASECRWCRGLSESRGPRRTGCFLRVRKPPVAAAAVLARRRKAFQPRCRQEKAVETVSRAFVALIPFLVFRAAHLAQTPAIIRLGSTRCSNLRVRKPLLSRTHHVPVRSACGCAEASGGTCPRTDLMVRHGELHV